MGKIIAALVATIVVIGVVGFIALSGGDDDTGDETAATDTTSSADTTTDSGDPTVGAPIDLKTFDTTLTATVTDYRVVTGGQYDKVPAGGQLVGVELSLENTGGSTFSDSPGNGAALTLNDGTPVKPTFPTGGDCPSLDFSTSVDIPAGATRSGCIAFKLRAGQEAADFRYTPDSGFADDTGTWVLPPLG